MTLGSGNVRAPAGPQEMRDTITVPTTSAANGKPREEGNKIFSRALVDKVVKCSK